MLINNLRAFIGGVGFYKEFLQDLRTLDYIARLELQQGERVIWIGILRILRNRFLKYPSGFLSPSRLGKKGAIIRECIHIARIQLQGRLVIPFGGLQILFNLEKKIGDKNKRPDVLRCLSQNVDELVKRFIGLTRLEKRHPEVASRIHMSRS